MIGADAGHAAMETTERLDQPSARQPPPQRLRNMILQLIEQSSAFRNFEADTLVDTARDALQVGVVEIRAIERWLGAIFPPPAVRPPQRVSIKQRNPPAKRENRERKRKREYAYVQSLYKKNIKACLSHVLGSGSGRERLSPVKFRDYWPRLHPLWRRIVVDGDMAALRELYGEARQVASAGQSYPPSAQGIHLEGLGEGAAAQFPQWVGPRSGIQ